MNTVAYWQRFWAAAFVVAMFHFTLVMILSESRQAVQLELDLCHRWGAMAVPPTKNLTLPPPPRDPDPR